MNFQCTTIFGGSFFLNPQVLVVAVIAEGLYLDDR